MNASPFDAAREHPREELMEPDIDPSDAKKAINNVLWMFGPKALTLVEAEARALKMLEIVLDTPGTFSEPHR